MKKSLLIIGALIFGSSFFSSCNNKLKDDIEGMEKEIADLKDKQEETKAILGANEPITATSTFVDDEGETQTITQTFKFKSNDDWTQYMGENEDGTYSIYIERFSDVEWYEGAWVSFEYDPETKSISEQRGGHYWDNNDIYGNSTWLAVDYFSVDADVEITLHSINLQTGNISLSFSGLGSGEYTQEIANNWGSYYTPNAGEEMTTAFSFSGKLKVFPYVEGLSEEVFASVAAKSKAKF